MLLNFQTMVTDLVSMDVCNASLLDEATAAAEAMQMCISTAKKRNKFFVSDRVAQHTINLLQTRAEPIGVDVVVGSPDSVDLSANDFAGAMVQYPDTFGRTEDWATFSDRAHDSSTLVVACTDLMACTMLVPQVVGR